LQAEREKEDRRRVRKAKRKRLGIPVSPEPGLRPQRAEDSDSTEAVESDDAPEDYSGMKRKSKSSQKSKKHRKPFVSDSYEREKSEDEDTGTDDSLMGELRDKKNKGKAKKLALQALRDKRTAAQTKESGGQSKTSKKSSEVSLHVQQWKIEPMSEQKQKITRRLSSSSSDVLMTDVGERRQAQSRSESTDTSVSRQLASTVKDTPKSSAFSASLGRDASNASGILAVGGISTVGRGRGALRGGLGPRNVFASRGPAKKRPTLIQNSADPSKDPKLYNNMHIRRKAELAGRGLADAAPDVSVLGGLFAASNPSNYNALKPARRKALNTASNQQGLDLETSPMDNK
jgi:chromo domain-containing protein 1